MVLQIMFLSRAEVVWSRLALPGKLYFLLCCKSLVSLGWFLFCWNKYRLQCMPEGLLSDLYLVPLRSSRGKWLQLSTPEGEDKIPLDIVWWGMYCRAWLHHCCRGQQCAAHRSFCLLFYSDWVVAIFLELDHLRSRRCLHSGLVASQHPWCCDWSQRDGSFVFVADLFRSFHVIRGRLL